MVIMPRSLNAQLLLLVSCILLATGAMSGWLTARNQSGMLKAAMHRTAEVMTGNLGDRCAYYLVLQDFAGLESFLGQAAGRADIRRLQVCDPAGIVVGDVESDPAGTPRRKTGAACLVPPGQTAPLLLVENGELVIWQPIEAGSLIGWLKATYSLAAIQKLERETWRNGLLLSLFWVAGTIALLLLVLRPAVGDIDRLVEFARDLDARKGAQLAIRPGTAELEELGAALNYASTRLLATDQQLIRDKEALQEQYSTLRGIIDSADALIFSLDRQYRYTSFNSAHASVMQAIYGREIRIGESLLECMTVQEDREKAQRNIDRALVGESFVESAYSGEDARARHYYEVSHNPIRAGDGSVIGVAVFSRDITERRQAEKALLVSEERFRRLAENAVDVIYRMSLPDGIYEYISPAVMELFGYAPEEFYASPQLIRQVIHPDWLGYFAEQWSGLLRGEMPPTYEYRIIHKSGQIRWVNQRNILIRGDGGGIVAIEGIVTDITKRKIFEEEIRTLNAELEQRVRERTAELEAKNVELAGLNKIFVGRELRMMQLKEEIRQLELRVSAREAADK
jgi:PAS domain S-box-containing protein